MILNIFTIKIQFSCKNAMHVVYIRCDFLPPEKIGKNFIVAYNVKGFRNIMKN